MKSIPIKKTKAEENPPLEKEHESPEEGMRYRQVADEIRRHVARLPTGSPVPSTSYWRGLLKVSRTTIIRAFAELKAEGLLRTRIGAATVTAEPSRHRTVLVLWSSAGGGNAHDGGMFLTGACRAAEECGRVQVTHVPAALIGEGWDPRHTYRELGGVLFFRAPELAARLEPILGAQRIPWLLYGSTAYASQMAVDDRAVADLVLDELARQGHRRIGMVWREGHGPGLSRFEAWKAWHWERGLSVDATMAHAHGDGGADDGAALLALAQKVTAIFAATDGEAVHVMECLRPRGVRFPKDLSLIGVDNMHLTAALRPGLTTVQFPLEEHGAKCLARLLTLKHGAVVEREVLGDMHLVSRGTVAAPRRRMGSLAPTPNE